MPFVSFSGIRADERACARASAEHEPGIGKALPVRRPSSTVLVLVRRLCDAQATRYRAMAQDHVRVVQAVSLARPKLADGLIRIRAHGEAAVCVLTRWCANSTAHRARFQHHGGRLVAFASVHPVNTLRVLVLALGLPPIALAA